MRFFRPPRITRRTLTVYLMSRVLLGATLAWAAADVSDPTAKGLALEQKQEWLQAELSFAQAATSQDDYREALLERQKIAYRQAEWGKFFGRAAWIRKRFAAQGLESDFVLLEAMALVRHCQFESASRIVQAVGDDPRAQPLRDLLAIQMKIPGNVTTQAKSADVRLFSKDVSWKIRSDTKGAVLGKIAQRPDELRVYVQNRCADEKSAQP